MSYHMNDLEDFDIYVSAYADEHGYVPEEGDHWREFVWDEEDLEYVAENWAEHVGRAVRATKLAQVAKTEGMTLNHLMSLGTNTLPSVEEVREAAKRIF